MIQFDKHIKVVVSNICYFHLYLEESIQFDFYFSDGLKPPTSICFKWVGSTTT